MISKYGVSYVLAHNHEGTNGSKFLAHDADLFGGDVVDVNEDALGVGVGTLLHVAPHSVLAGFFVYFDGHIIDWY
jgi:hypothetical protein